MPTQFISKMNRTEAGFHLLVILSLSDGKYDSVENDVIIEFLSDAFPGKIDLIKEQAFLRIFPQEEWEMHFREVAARFYAISVPEDRNHLLDFAMKVVIADDKVTPDENVYINLLYDAWDLA